MQQHYNILTNFQTVVMLQYVVVIAAFITLGLRNKYVNIYIWTVNPVLCKKRLNFKQLVAVYSKCSR